MKIFLTLLAELYTDESPGLKIDPVVVLVLSLGFIFSVVALHSEPRPSFHPPPPTLPLAMKFNTLSLYSHCQNLPQIRQCLNHPGWQAELLAKGSKKLGRGWRVSMFL